MPPGWESEPPRPDSPEGYNWLRDTWRPPLAALGRRLSSPTTSSPSRYRRRRSVSRTHRPSARRAAGNANPWAKGAAAAVGRQGAPTCAPPNCGPNPRTSAWPGHLPGAWVSPHRATTTAHHHQETRPLTRPTQQHQRALPTRTKTKISGPLTGRSTSTGEARCGSHRACGERDPGGGAGSASCGSGDRMGAGAHAAWDRERGAERPRGSGRDRPQDDRG
jgi:hypothetical protein